MNQPDGMLRLQKKTIYEALGRESVHPFPARMAPGIALQAITELKKPVRILDPMVGSGTVIALARLMGHKAIGIDVDPLAILISKVWTTSADVDQVRRKAREVLLRAREIFNTMPQGAAYPLNSDLKTRKFVAYWFDGYARKQLASLSRAISRVRDEVTRNILQCAFSRLIIAKSSGASLAMDLSHSRPHKAFRRAPKKPFHAFLAAVDRVVENCVSRKQERRGSAPRVHLGDARTLPVPDASIDLVLTSPPYLNAIDYMRCSKFSLVWMGYRIGDLSQIRSDSVGAEGAKRNSDRDFAIRAIISGARLKPKLRSRDHGILARYVDDMWSAMAEVSRVLAPGGRAVYVVGENTIRGTFIPNSKIISAIAQLCGLSLKERRVRKLPANRRYLPPPSISQSPAMDARMRREVVLAFVKPKRLKRS